MPSSLPGQRFRTAKSKNYRESAMTPRTLSFSLSTKTVTVPAPSPASASAARAAATVPVPQDRVSPTLTRQAVDNLVRNALTHGNNPALTLRKVE